MKPHLPKLSIVLIEHDGSLPCGGWRKAYPHLRAEVGCIQCTTAMLGLTAQDSLRS